MHLNVETVGHLIVLRRHTHRDTRSFVSILFTAHINIHSYTKSPIEQLLLGTAAYAAVCRRGFNDRKKTSARKDGKDEERTWDAQQVCVCLRGGNEIFLSQCYTSVCVRARVVHVSGFLPFNSLTICAQLPNEHDIMSALVCVNRMLFSLTVCVDVGFMRANSYTLYPNNRTLGMLTVNILCSVCA